MYITQFKWLLYSLYLTNYYGYKLKKTDNAAEQKKLRLAYAHTLLSKLKINIHVENKHLLPDDGQYLLLSNHRSIIDPLIVEIALEQTPIYGLWIAKKELYNSSFFGLFVRNAGAILLDREQKQMGNFFASIKKEVQQGHSIFIFPEGTRNKTKHPLIPFKEGARIIALKNRLPMLPIYIKSNAGEVLKNAISTRKTKQQDITIIIGAPIHYRDKTNLEVLYKERFQLP